MKINIITFLFISFSATIYAQKGTDILLEIDKTPVSVSEFKKLYERNIELLADDSEKELKNYLDLYINYRLKLKQAYQLKLDTTRSYKREIETYKNQLSTPYLQDTIYLNKLVKDAYFRTKYEIKASHILVKLSANASSKDTLVAYQKIIKARNDIIAGKSFSTIAKTISDDKSAKSNGGDLGYFTAFKMVYPFENAAYNTKIKEISMPFKTRYGYHIVKVFDLKRSKGELEVAHILITDKTSKGKNTIDSLYNRLKKGDDFTAIAKVFSNDTGTSRLGGKLPKFGIGRMIKSFETVAYSLTNEKEISEPFKTNYGWHIIKLLKKHPVKPFSELKSQLKSRVKSSGIAKLTDLSVLNRLKKKYKIEIYKDNLAVFLKPNSRNIPKDSLKKGLLTINDKKITQTSFSNYILNRRHKPAAVLFDDFVDEEILKYFKENLVHTEPDYAAILKEYEDGLLMFDLMQQKVWDKSVNDSLGLQIFFTSNKTRYSSKDLTKNKGEVINDYQTYLEDNWIKELKAIYSVKIRKRTLKKLVRSYRKK